MSIALRFHHEEFSTSRSTGAACSAPIHEAQIIVIVVRFYVAVGSALQ